MSIVNRELIVFTSSVHTLIISSFILYRKTKASYDNYHSYRFVADFENESREMLINRLGRYNQCYLHGVMNFEWFTSVPNRI
jgi:hypothetical protein